MNAFDLHSELKKVLSKYPNVPFELRSVHGKRDDVCAYTAEGFSPRVEITYECGLIGGKVDIVYSFTKPDGWKDSYYEWLKKRAQDFNNAARNAKFEHIYMGSILGQVVDKSFATEIDGAEIANEILWDLFGRSLTNNIITHMRLLSEED